MDNPLTNHNGYAILQESERSAEEKNFWNRSDQVNLSNIQAYEKVRREVEQVGKKRGKNLLTNAKICEILPLPNEDNKKQAKRL
jgi:hypothetical protein